MVSIYELFCSLHFYAKKKGARNTKLVFQTPLPHLCVSITPSKWNCNPFFVFLNIFTNNPSFFCAFSAKTAEFYLENEIIYKNNFFINFP